MDRLYRRWQINYDKQKKKEEDEAKARGEDFEGVEGDNTSLVTDDEDGTGAAPEPDAAKSEIEKTTSDIESIDITDYESDDSCTTVDDAHSGDSGSSSSSSSSTSSDGENSDVQQEDLQPIPRTRQAHFSESDNTSDYSTWELSLADDSDVTNDSQLSETEKEKRQQRRKEKKEEFAGKRGKQRKKNKKLKPEDQMPMRKEDLTADELQYTRDGMRKWVVKKPEEARKQDQEAVRKIDEIASNEIGHHPADAMTAGNHARIIEVPPPDNENVTEDDIRRRVLREQNDIIASLQGTLNILQRRQDWYDRRFKKSFVDKQIDRQTMADRSSRIRRQYMERLAAAGAATSTSAQAQTGAATSTLAQAQTGAATSTSAQAQAVAATSTSAQAATSRPLLVPRMPGAAVLPPRPTPPVPHQRPPLSEIH